MMRTSEKPMARPASTKSLSLTVTVGALAMRANRGATVREMATIRLIRLAPSTATISRPMIKVGKDMNTSITRMMTLSIMPPL